MEHLKVLTELNQLTLSDSLFQILMTRSQKKEALTCVLRVL